MTNLTKEELMGVASRAFLQVSEEEAAQYTEAILETLSKIEKLNEVNTEGVIPMTHVSQYVNVMREDNVANVLDRDVMLDDVIEHKDGDIKVPAIL